MKRICTERRYVRARKERCGITDTGRHLLAGANTTARLASGGGHGNIHLDKYSQMPNIGIATRCLVDLRAGADVGSEQFDQNSELSPGGVISNGCISL
jgi:hypothetical protein